MINWHKQAAEEETLTAPQDLPAITPPTAEEIAAPIPAPPLGTDAPEAAEPTDAPQPTEPTAPETKFKPEMSADDIQMLLSQLGQPTVLDTAYRHLAARDGEEHQLLQSWDNYFPAITQLLKQDNATDADQQTAEQIALLFQENKDYEFLFDNLEKVLKKHIQHETWANESGEWEWWAMGFDGQQIKEMMNEWQQHGQ